MHELELLKEKYKKDLLFVGYRGSHALGLSNEASDVDLLAVVTDNHSNAKEQKDIMVMNLTTFGDQLKLVGLEVIEAITTPVYISKRFNYDKLMNLLVNNYSLFNYGLKRQLFMVLKNQLKQIDKNKGERKAKFKGKTYLYYSLIKRQHTLLRYIQSHTDHDLMDDYLAIRNGDKSFDKDIDMIRKYRQNDHRRMKFAHMWQKLNKELSQLEIKLLKR